MTTKNIGREILIAAIAIAPLIYLFAIWNALPTTLPIHFDAEGNPNNYGSRMNLAYTLLFITVGINLLLMLIPKIDPKNNFTIFDKTYIKLRMVFAILFSAIGFMIILSAKNGKSEVSITFIMIAILISMIGNYMGKIRANYFVGIRSPWTLESEVVWQKTHQLAGKLWFFSGVALTILMLILPIHFKFPVFISTIVVISLVPYFYSYKIFSDIKKEGNRSQSPETGSTKTYIDVWRGPFYVNKNDPRIVVPKLNPSMGFTLNFGNPYTWLIMSALVMFFVFISRIAR